MFSSAQRGFKPISPIRLGTQDISIKDIQELIDYLGEHANSDPSRKLIEVLTDWLKSAGYPNPQPLLMIDQAMLQAIKEAMSTCLDILEYRRATNTKAVRYIHGVLQEVRVRAEIKLSHTALDWAAMWLGQELRELSRPQRLAAREHQGAVTITHGQDMNTNITSMGEQSHGNDTRSGNRGVRAAPAPAGPILPSRPPMFTSTTSAAPVNSLAAYPPPGAHPSFVDPIRRPPAPAPPALPATAASTARRRTLSTGFSPAVIMAARTAPPLPRPWFVARDRREWAAAEILLLVYEETRGPYRAGLRHPHFPIIEWCKYRLTKWGFERMHHVIRAKRTRLQSGGWYAILRDQAERFVARGEDPNHIAMWRARPGLLDRQAPAGQTDDIWERWG